MRCWRTSVLTAPLMVTTQPELELDLDESSDEDVDRCELTASMFLTKDVDTYVLDIHS